MALLTPSVQPKEFSPSGADSSLDLASGNESNLSARVTAAASLPLSTPRSNPLEPLRFIRPTGMPFSEFSAMFQRLDPTSSKFRALLQPELVNTFTRACALPHIEVVEELLNIPDLNIPDKTLHEACLDAVKSGNIDLVKVFFHSPRYKCIRPTYHGGVLIAAAINKHPEVVEALISSPLFNSIPIDLINAAYVWAAGGGSLDIVNKLSSNERMHPISPELFGQAFFEAAKNGHSHIVAAFISKELFQEIPAERLTEAFRYAAHIGFDTITELLVSSNRSGELSPEFGLALINAAGREDLKILHILVSSILFCNADPEDFETACLEASKSKNPNTLNLLISHLSREQHKNLLKEFLKILPKDPNELIIRCSPSSSGVLEWPLEREICNNLVRFLWNKIVYM
jgi:hypothetical protein